MDVSWALPVQRLVYVEMCVQFKPCINNVNKPVQPAGRTCPFVPPSPVVPSALVFPSPAYLGTKHHGHRSTRCNGHEIPVLQP